MATYHIVEQGDYLSGIAKKYGFFKHETIWDHPKNAELKRKRENPNVIHPEDRIFIPDKQATQEIRSTDKAHRFRLQTERLQLRLVLEDLYEKPIDNALCALRLEDGAAQQLITDGAGLLEKDIRRGLRSAMLIIKDPQTPANEIQIAINIGKLDPVDEPSGQMARLNNLGYFAGSPDNHEDEEREAMFLSAVEEFQCDHGLAVDGRCGPVTRAKLKEVHGC